jgi:hypothetical protein
MKTCSRRIHEFEIQDFFTNVPNVPVWYNECSLSTNNVVPNEWM